MPSEMSSNGPSTRIPAWKRIGLKLKFAVDHVENKTLPVPVPQAIETKRKRAVEGFESTDSKRAKISKTEQKSRAPAPQQSSGQWDLGRRKSVAFTSETKTDDGESAKQLYKAWIAEQKEKDPSFDLKDLGIAFSTPPPPQVTEDFDKNLDESERRVKRVKVLANDQSNMTIKKIKPQKIVRPQMRTSEASLQSALAYLTKFHDSKSTWKFNKTHQRNILKNAFDLDLIPSSYSELLYFYIAGLQGGARTLLQNAALEIKVKDQEQGDSGFPATMADAAKRQDEYDAALAEYVASILTQEAPFEMGYQEGILMGLSDYAMKPRMEKRMRAERILAVLGQLPLNDGDSGGGRPAEKEEDSIDIEKRLPQNDTSAKNVRRKRKQRTAVIDFTSSSEDSSDSENDGSNAGRRSQPISVSDEDSPSSVSISSGSDDDGDDESSESSEDAGPNQDESDSDSSEGTEGR